MFSGPSTYGNCLAVLKTADKWKIECSNIFEKGLSAILNLRKNIWILQMSPTIKFNPTIFNPLKYTKQNWYKSIFNSRYFTFSKYTSVNGKDCQIKTSLRLIGVLEVQVWTVSVNNPGKLRKKLETGWNSRAFNCKES